jgi:hypothetical protein
MEKFLNISSLYANFANLRILLVKHIETNVYAMCYERDLRRIRKATWELATVASGHLEGF